MSSPPREVASKSPRSPPSNEALRGVLAALDPDLVVATDEVDRSLIVIALERSPLERVAFAQQMMETLSGFRRVGEGL